MHKGHADAFSSHLFKVYFCIQFVKYLSNALLVEYVPTAIRFAFINGLDLQIVIVFERFSMAELAK